MKKNFHNEKGFFTILSLLLVVMVMGALYYVAMKVYFKAPMMDSTVGKVAQEQHIDTSSPRTVLNSTVDEIHRIEKQRLEDAERTNLFQLDEVGSGN